MIQFLVLVYANNEREKFESTEKHIYQEELDWDE